MDAVQQLKRKFDKLVAQRDAARQCIKPAVEGSDTEYRRLQKEVQTVYKDLMDARYKAGFDTTGYGREDA